MVRFLSAVRDMLLPSPAERSGEQRFARETIQRLQRVAPSHSRVVVAGSIAKGTFLRDARDLDIFLLLPLSVPKSRFEHLVRSLVHRAFPHAKHETRYAEHPYVRVLLPERRIDVVPAYAIRRGEEHRSAVDRSVLHTSFIRRHLQKKQIGEVLLLKKFLRAAELYGAEIRVQGFSGYLCELLVLRYENFSKLLQSAIRWTPGVFIDLKKYYPSQSEQIEIQKKFGTPLVVIDPVDRTRNVAAAVSGETVRKFVAIARAFRKKPGEKFFADPPSFFGKLERMKKKKGCVYAVRLFHRPAVDDILWGQLRKLAGHLRDFLEKNDFHVAETLLDNDKKCAHILLRISQTALPPTRWIPGPLLSLPVHVRAFKQAHTKAKFKIQQNKLCARIPRKLRTPSEALHSFFASATLPSHFISKPEVKKL